MDAWMPLSRSALFVPGASDKALRKSRNLKADILVFDLEDSVGESQKEEARSKVVDEIQQRPLDGVRVVVRINGISTPYCKDDLAAIRLIASDFSIMLPKLDGPADVRSTIELCDAIGIESSVKFWALVETARTILDPLGIAESSDRLEALALGHNDLQRYTGVSLDDNPSVYSAWLANCVAAARATNLRIFDSVFNNYENGALFKAACSRAASIGTDGKMLIHPSQIEICNEVFSPSDEKVRRAAILSSRFRQVEELTGDAVVGIDGEMIERLHAEMAERVISRASEKKQR